jgi:hypothetical protein
MVEKQLQSDWSRAPFMQHFTAKANNARVDTPVATPRLPPFDEWDGETSRRGRGNSAARQDGSRSDQRRAILSHEFTCGLHPVCFDLSDRESTYARPLPSCCLSPPLLSFLPSSALPEANFRGKRMSGRAPQQQLDAAAGNSSQTRRRSRSRERNVLLPRQPRQLRSHIGAAAAVIVAYANNGQ